MITLQTSNKAGKLALGYKKTTTPLSPANLPTSTSSPSSFCNTSPSGNTSPSLICLALDAGFLAGALAGASASFSSSAAFSSSLSPFSSLPSDSSASGIASSFFPLAVPFVPALGAGVFLGPLAGLEAGLDLEVGAALAFEVGAAAGVGLSSALAFLVAGVLDSGLDAGRYNVSCRSLRLWHKTSSWYKVNGGP